MLTRRSLIFTTAAGIATLPTMSLAGGHGRVGQFTGASNHVTTGRAELVSEGGKTYVNLLSNFTFDGAPDPKVALGRNGYDARTLMGKLQKNSGAQRYQVPAGVDASQYNEVWIWCERFNVPLGVARL